MLPTMKRLTPQEITTLVVKGETLTTEFKRRRSNNDFTKHDLVDAVTCLANGPGGQLLIGVEDDGTISGCFPFHRTGTTDPVRIEAMIQANTRPTLPTLVSAVQIDGKDVVAVQVPPQPTPVCTAKGLYQHRIMRQDGRPACVAMDPAYLFSAYREGKDIDWALLPAYESTLTDILPSALQHFRELTSEPVLRVLDDTALLTALGLRNVESHELTLGAILLFGTESAIARYVPHHEVLFQALRGTSVVKNESLRGPIIPLMSQIIERIRPFQREEEIYVGLGRVGLQNLPDRVAREAVANALVHRDYTQPGAITITLSDDAFRVASPGGLPRGVTLNNILTASNPRSRTLADVFRRAGLVERTGRGVQIMFVDALTAGSGTPEYDGTTPDQVELVYPISRADHEFAHFVREWSREHPQLTITELRILHILRERGRLSTPAIAEELRLSTAQIHSSLSELTTSDVVLHTGRGAGSLNALGPAFFAFTGSKHRAPAGDPKQQILDYLEEHDQITRAVAMQIGALSGDQASRALTALVESKKLTRHGKGRGTYYTEA